MGRPVGTRTFGGCSIPSPLTFVVATIYGCHMSTQKTTLYLDAGAYRRLQELAREQGRPAAELIREAVAEYAARHAPRPRPRSIGALRSGVGDLAERAEERLAGMGEAGEA